MDEAAKHIAQSLASGEKRAIFLGNLACHHPRYAELHRLGQEIARLCGATLGIFGEAANSVGGALAGALPGAGLNASAMLAQPRKAYLLLHADINFDCADAPAARAAMQAAELVVAMSAFKLGAHEYAQVMLPIAPFTETAGTFVNTEGRVQSFQGVVRPLEETRPGWKVLRVLGNLLGLPGFDYQDVEAVRRECLNAAGNLATRLNNAIDGECRAALPPQPRMLPSASVKSRCIRWTRLFGMPTSLQQTRDARTGTAYLPGSMIERLGLHGSDQVRVVQNGNAVALTYERDDRLPANCVRLSGACRETAALGPLFGELSLERVVHQKKALA